MKAAENQKLGLVKPSEVHRWKPPAEGFLKVNVDASVFAGADTFIIGMVLRDHNGSFIQGKNLCLPYPGTVLEGEAIGVKEALTWIKELQLHNISIESDSRLTVKAINENVDYQLEVGDVLEGCRCDLLSMAGVVVSYIRKQANKVAHGIARIPCSIGCSNVFTSPPACMLETILYDISS